MAPDPAVEGQGRMWDQLSPGKRGGKKARKPALARDIEFLKAKLGLGNIAIHTGEGAKTATEGRGAHGLAHKNDIYVHPTTWEAGDTHARMVIAHELVHHAQASLPVIDTVDRDAAEQEAKQLALRYATSGDIDRPRIPIEIDTRAHADTDAEKELDPREAAQAFIKEWGEAIGVRIGGWDEIINKDGRAPVMPDPPFLSISPKGLVGAVFDHLLGPSSKNMWSALSRVLGESRLVTMIQQGRDDKAHFLDPKSSRRFTMPEFEHFADDLRAHMVPIIGQSVARVGRRYAMLRTAKALRQMRDRNYRTGQWPEDKLVPQVDESQLVPSHPMDRAVIKMMCEPAYHMREVGVKFAEVFAAYPNLEQEVEIQGTELREVKFHFEIEEGLHNWITVMEPANVSPEEVAHELYGDSAEAHTLIRAGRRFGFVSPMTKPLADKHQARWDEGYKKLPPHQSAGDLAPTSSDVLFVGERDAAREMLADPTLAEAAIRAQSEQITVKESGASLGILQRYSFITTQLAACEGNLKQLPLATSIMPVLTRATQRAERIQAGDESLAKTYDVSSNIQQQITTASMSALANLVEGWTKLKAGFDSNTPLTAYGEMIRPYQKVAYAFADALSASELPETGLERLDTAQLYAREMPLDMLEAMLANARQMIMAARANLDDPNGAHQRADFQYGIDDMEQTERWVRAEIRRAREVIINDPSMVGEVIGNISEKISQLQTNSTILLSVQTCNALVKELHAHRAGWFDPTDKNGGLRDGEKIVDQWKAKWDVIWDLYTTAYYAAPDKKEAANKALETAFKGLANDPEWKKLHERIGAIIAKEEKWAKWARIGILIGIAIATMGAGVWAAGFAAGAEFGLVGTALFVSGVEALTATTLGQLLVDDPTLKGFFVQLGESFVTFVIFRAAAAGYRGIAGVSTGAVIGEVVGFQLVDTLKTVHEANEAKKKATGKGLSSDELWDVVVEGLIVSGASALAGWAGKNKLEKIRIAAEDHGKAYLTKRVGAIETIDLNTVALANAAKLSKKPADLYKALESERQAIEARQQLFEDLLKNDGKRAKDAGLDPEKLAVEAGELDMRLADNRQAQDMLMLEPVAPGEFLYPARDLPGFLERQQTDPATKQKSKTTVEPIEADKFTSAKRYRVTPEHGQPFIVTEKLPGMGRVVGGLVHGKEEPHTGLVDLADKPLFTQTMVERGEHIRVGHPVDSHSEGLQILRGLAEGDPHAYARIGLDAPNRDRFQPNEVEWGLGRRGKEYIIIKGDHGAVDWTNFPGVVAVAHTHPFRGGKGLKDLGPDQTVPFQSLLPGSNLTAGKLHNVTVVFPSAADIVFMGSRGIDGHIVHTPYRIKIVDGKPMLMNPTHAGPEATALSFEIGKPELVGYYEGNHDTPVYKSRLKADAAGFSQDVYAVNHPTHGSLLSFTPPSQMTHVAPGTAHAPTQTVTASGDRFEPRSDVDRRAMLTWEELKASPLPFKGDKMTFEGDFLPMYREGWTYDLHAQKWKKPGSTAEPSEVPANASDEAALGHLRRDDEFLDMIANEKIVPRDALIAEVGKLKPAGRNAIVVRGQLKEQLRGAVIDHVIAHAPQREARQLEFNRITRKLADTDRELLAAEFYRRNYLKQDSSTGPVTIARDQGHMTTDRTFDATTERNEGGETDGIWVKTGVKVVPGDTELTPREIQEARDFRRVLGEQVESSADVITVDRLRYVFMSEEGARKNIAFIEAMLDGDGAISSPATHVEIEVVDRGGKRYRLTKRSELDTDVNLGWLRGERKRSDYKADQQRVTRELVDGELHDASIMDGHGAKDFDPRHRLDIDATDYDLTSQTERTRFVEDVIRRVSNRKVPDKTRQGVFVDLRGRDVDQAAIERMRMRIVDGSDGAVHDRDLVFVQGKVDPSLDATRFGSLRSKAVTDGGDGAVIDRLVTVMQERGINATTVAAWHEKPFQLLGQPEVVTQLEAVNALARAGRIRGLTAWMEFSAPKVGEKVQRAAELREAQRRATEDPDVVIDIGNDAHTPTVAGKRLQSFDGTVMQSNAPIASYEVQAIGQPIQNSGQMTDGVGHAANKVKSRADANHPVAGATKEAVIHIELASRAGSKKDGFIDIAPNGDRQRVLDPSKTKAKPGDIPNLFDEFAGKIKNSPNHMLLDVVIIVDDRGVKARYERSGSTWTRVK